MKHLEPRPDRPHCCVNEPTQIIPLPHGLEAELSESPTDPLPRMIDDWDADGGATWEC